MPAPSSFDLIVLEVSVLLVIQAALLAMQAALASQTSEHTNRVFAYSRMIS